MANEKKFKIICCQYPTFDQVMDQMGMTFLDPRLDNASWWYLHGELEMVEGYDKGVIYNMDEFPELQKDVITWNTIDGDIAKVRRIERHKELFFTGIMPVEIYDNPEPATGFFWVEGKQKVKAVNLKGMITEFEIWKQKGLVVFDSDPKGMKEAREHYEQGRIHQ